MAQPQVRLRRGTRRQHGQNVDGITSSFSSPLPPISLPSPCLQTITRVFLLSSLSSWHHLSLITFTSVSLSSLCLHHHPFLTTSNTITPGFPYQLITPVSHITTPHYHYYYILLLLLLLLTALLLSSPDSLQTSFPSLPTHHYGLTHSFLSILKSWLSRSKRKKKKKNQPLLLYVKFTNKHTYIHTQK